MSDKNELKELLKSHQDLHSELMKIFKKEEQCLIWLTRTKAPLGDVTPISLIDSKEGKEQVLDMLYRIKTGDFS